MAEEPHADPRERADELVQRARGEVPESPLEGLPPVETDFNRNPLGGLPSVEHDFNRNPLDVPKVGTPSEPARDRGLVIFFGVVILFGGIALLVWSSANAPTAENLLTRDWVLKREYYNLFRFVGWGAIAVGALMSLYAIVRKATRP